MIAKIRTHTEYKFSHKAPKNAWALIPEDDGTFVLLYKRGVLQLCGSVDRDLFYKAVNEFNLKLEDYYYELGTLTEDDMLMVTHSAFGELS